MKKTKNKLLKNHPLLPILVPVLAVSLLILGGVKISQANSIVRVLGEESEKPETVEQPEKPEEVEQPEKPEEVEQPETPEKVEQPETPEKVEQPEMTDIEKEVKNTQVEVQSQVESGSVKQVEVHASKNGTQTGSIKVERTDGSTSEKDVPATNVSLISVHNEKSGTVDIKVNEDGTVTMINNGITVKTNSPLIIDPQSQTVGIKTAAGVMPVNQLPSQAFGKTSSNVKLSSVDSAVLGAKNGQVYYDVVGTQKRKFAGIIPVNAPIVAKISADSGVVISSTKPWYLNWLGFLYTD